MVRPALSSRNRAEPRAFCGSDVPTKSGDLIFSALASILTSSRFTFCELPAGLFRLPAALLTDTCRLCVSVLRCQVQ